MDNPGLDAKAAMAPGAKVLVIDDSNTIRRSAEIFLRQGGHEVLLAEDGFDALAKVNDHAPELIFCDILMPRLDGYQTCAIIKRNPRFAHVPVIMLSSMTSTLAPGAIAAFASSPGLSKRHSPQIPAAGRKPAPQTRAAHRGTGLRACE